mmetsp:Transcript_7781/g.12575  ORF Transcript_7781/g.12575 Transcript_7781/m.12575 type:complete len:85 (+) Transcript_7781:1048-1302(+)
MDGNATDVSPLGESERLRHEACARRMRKDITGVQKQALKKSQEIAAGVSKSTNGVKDVSVSVNEKLARAHSILLELDKVIQSLV